MKLEVKKDRKEINKIIENCLPLMKKNNSMTQECADAIIVYFINKLEIIYTAQNNTVKQNSKDLKVKPTAQLNNQKKFMSGYNKTKEGLEKLKRSRP